VFNYAKSKYTHIYIYSEPGQVHLAYVVSVIDYNISLFRTALRSNYAIIDYTMLQLSGIWNFPLTSRAYKSYSLDFHIWIFLLSLFLGMILSKDRSSNKCNIVQKTMYLQSYILHTLLPLIMK
jgi:hypothetical protein